MTFKNSIALLLVFSLFLSCSEREKFPITNSEQVSAEKISLNHQILKAVSVLTDSTVQPKADNQVQILVDFKRFYEARNEEFDLNKLEKEWQSLKPVWYKFEYNEMKNWIEITGFLLELTGKQEYAEMLENITLTNEFAFSDSKIQQLGEIIAPYVFTMNVDHVYINLFCNATLKYNHSLKGAVKIVQETDYPLSRKILLKFSMENKRYIELHVRIPVWADGATVTEKNVKYVANPGEYCLIARKWGDGDVVEIEF